MGLPFLSQSVDPQSAGADPRRGDGGEGHRRQSTAARGRAADRQQDRRSAAVCRRADQDGGGIGLSKEVDGHYELSGPSPLAIPVHLARLAHGAARPLGDGERDRPIGATLGREFNYELLQAVSPFTRKHYNKG